MYKKIIAMFMCLVMISPVLSNMGLVVGNAEETPTWEGVDDQFKIYTDDDAIYIMDLDNDGKSSVGRGKDTFWVLGDSKLGSFTTSNGLADFDSSWFLNVPIIPMSTGDIGYTDYVSNKQVNKSIIRPGNYAPSQPSYAVYTQNGKRIIAQSNNISESKNTIIHQPIIPQKCKNPYKLQIIGNKDNYISKKEQSDGNSQLLKNVSFLSYYFLFDNLSLSQLVC